MPWAGGVWARCSSKGVCSPSQEAARAAAAESDFQGGGSLGAMSVEAQYHQQQLLLRQQQQEQLQRLRIQQEQQLAIQQQIWLEERRQLEEQQRVREAAQRAQREADSNADVASDLLGVGGGGGHTWHGESERWLDMLNLRSSHDPSGGVTPTGAASGQHTPRDAMSPVAWGTTHSSASTTTPPSALQDAPSTLSGLFEPPTRAEDQTTPVSSPSGGPPPRATPTHPTATRLFSTFQPPSNTIPSMSAGGRARGGGPSMSGPPGGNTLPDLAAIARNGPRMYPPANNGARMVPPRNSDALMAQAGLAAGQNTWHFRDPALQEQWASFLLEKRERSASPEPGR